MAVGFTQEISFQLPVEHGFGVSPLSLPSSLQHMSGLVFLRFTWLRNPLPAQVSSLLCVSGARKLSPIFQPGMGAETPFLILFYPALLGVWVWMGASSAPSPVSISHFHEADSSQGREKWTKWSSWKTRGSWAGRECGEVLVVSVGEGRC